MSSSSSSSSSVISSMDSAQEELQSLRRTSTQQNSKVGAGRGFLDFARKSFSTNSSPVKQRLDSADDHDGIQDDVESDMDQSDKEFDTKSLGFDPFLDATDVETPIANSTVLLSAQIGDKFQKRSKNKSVRFHDWEKTLDENQQQILRTKLKQFKKSKAPSVKSLHFNSVPLSKDRVSSSEYSATPDTTEISDTHDQSGTLTATQKLYMLPQENQTERKTYLKRSEQYIPLTDLTKTPKLVKSSTDPIVSASTDESSVFSKADTVTEPSAKLENDETQQQNKVKHRSKSWHKLQNLQSVKGDQSHNAFHDEDTTSHSITQKFKAMNIKDGNSKRTKKVAASGSPFSLRLHKVSKLEDKTPRSQGSNEESYNHVDILEQSPPRLPEVSNPDVTSVFEKDSSLQELTEPLFESIAEVQLGSAESCRINLKFEVQDLIKQSIETLSHASGNPVVIEDEQILNEALFTGKIEQIQNLSQSCDKKMDSLKIQIIKLSKQLSDHKSTEQEKENFRKILQKKLKDVIDELESLRVECSRYESRINSQSNTITFERQTNEKLEKELSTQKRMVAEVQNNLEDKELFVESITRLVRSNYLDHELDVLDEKKVLEALRDMMMDYSHLRETNRERSKVENALQKHSSELQKELDKYKIENQAIKESLKDCNAEITARDQELKRKDNLLKDLKLENENCANLLKSLECSYSDLRNQLENEKFRTKELETKLQELEVERDKNARKNAEMEKVLKDQLSVVDDVQNEIEKQASTITKLQEDNEKLKEEKLLVTQHCHTYKNKVSSLESEISDATNQYRRLQLSNEDAEKRINRVVRSKEEEILGYRRRVGDLELVESNLGNELKETRAKLSDKFSQYAVLEKRVGNLTQSLKDSNENNRLLRSEMLKTNGLRQELKRTLIGLSISIVRDLDGIIDNESLSTVREDLKNETDDKNLEKLHDIALFIEEAVGLIIKDYWSLNKRLSDSQKGSLSNSSLSALQLIIEGQNDRLKRLQGKLQYYESIFKKINKANEKSQIRTRPSTSSVKDDTKRVRVQLSRDSDDSYATVRTVHTNPLREKKADEINRLLSKVKASGSSISESSE